MKKLNSILLIGLLLVFMGCNNHRTTDATDVNDFGTEMNRDAADSRGSADHRMDNTRTQGTTGSDMALNTQERQDLYKELNMTQDQIYTFEAMEEQHRSGKENVNTSMDTRMREVLSANQYKMYENWRDKRTNTHGNQMNQSQTNQGQNQNQTNQGQNQNQNRTNQNQTRVP